MTRFATSVVSLLCALLFPLLALASHHHGHAHHHPPSEEFYQAFESTFVKVITPDSFDLEVIRAPDASPVLLTICSSWSSNCKEFQPALIEAASTLASVNSAAKFVFLDADVHRVFVRRFRVRQLPTLVIFGKYPEGKSHPRVVGEMEMVDVQGSREKRLIWAEVDQVHALSAEAIVDHMQIEEVKDLDTIVSRKQREAEAAAHAAALERERPKNDVSDEELRKHFEDIETLRRAPVHTPEMEARAQQHQERLSRRNAEREERRMRGTLTEEDQYHIRQEEEMRRARQQHDEHLQNIMLEHEKAMADVRRKLMEEQMDASRQQAMDRVRRESEERIQKEMLMRQAMQNA